VTVEKRREKVEAEKENLRRVVRRKLTRGVFNKVIEETGKSVLRKFRVKRQRCRVNSAVDMVKMKLGDE